MVTIWQTGKFEGKKHHHRLLLLPDSSIIVSHMKSVRRERERDEHGVGERRVVVYLTSDRMGQK